MIYQGDSIRVDFIEDGIADLQFAAAGSVNKFDQKTLEEFSTALKALADTKDLRGVIVTSSKPTFIVGADITEFLTLLPTLSKPKNGLPWPRAFSTNSKICQYLRLLP